MANKIRQSHLIKGVSLFGNEIKLSQNKFGLTRTNFLQFYLVIHAIPKNLVSKALISYEIMFKIKWTWIQLNIIWPWTWSQTKFNYNEIKGTLLAFCK